MHTFDNSTYAEYWDDCLWRELPEVAVLPRSPRYVGRKYNRHNSTIPPLDFRLYAESSV